MIAIWIVPGVILLLLLILLKPPSWVAPALVPPMSDEEFIAACGPGTDPEVALGVRRIVSEKLCIPYEEIYPSHRFIEDLKAD